MENNLENAMDLSAELLEDIPEVHVVGKHTVAIIVAATVITGGIAYGIHRFLKYRREQKGIIDGEILGVEEAPEEN